MKKKIIGIIWLGLMVCLSACAGESSAINMTTQPTSNVTLTVSAAADLIPAFTEIGALFTQETGIKVEFNFGSTGQLAQQVLQGAHHLVDTPR
jgi:molybdate transport system substrate-binding protein